MKLPRLKTAMTPFPYSVTVDAPLAEAEALMAEHDFHHLPVTRDGHVVAMLGTALLAARRAAGAAPATVAEACDFEVYVVDIGTALGEVVRGLAERRRDAAVVMRQGRLAGVFTAHDAHRAFADLLDELGPPAGDDDAA